MVVALGLGASAGIVVPAGAAGAVEAQSPFSTCYLDGRPVTGATPFPTAPGSPPTPPPATIPCHVLENLPDDDDGLPTWRLAITLGTPALLITMGIAERIRRGRW
jgi:hypothetical protein